MPIVILRSIFIVVIIVWYSSTVLRFINDYFRKEFETYIEKDLKNDKFYKKSQIPSEQSDVTVVGQQQLSKIDLNLNTFIVNKNEHNNQKYTNNDDEISEFKNRFTKTTNQKENYKETLPHVDEKLQNWLENMQYTTTDIETNLLKINEKSIQKINRNDDDDSKMKKINEKYTKNDNKIITNLNDKCIQNHIENVYDENYQQINECYLPVNKHDSNNKHFKEIKEDL